MGASIVLALTCFFLHGRQLRTRSTLPLLEVKLAHNALSDYRGTLEALDEANSVVHMHVFVQSSP